MLEPGGKILAGSVEMFLEPTTLRDGYRVPFCWEQDIDGITFEALREAADDRGAPTSIGSSPSP